MKKPAKVLPIALINLLKPKKINAAILAAFLIALTIPLTVYVVQNKQELRSRAETISLVPVFSGWRSLGGILTDAPGTAVFNNQIYVFAKGSDNALYVKHSIDGANFTDWQNLGGVLTSKPSAVSFNGQLYVLVRGSDNALYLKSSTDGVNFSNWRSLGGLLTFAPTASVASNKLFIFAGGPNRQLYTVTSTDGVNFTPWQSLGGILTDAPGAATFANQVYIFAKGTDNALYVKHSIDGANFTDWQSLGGVLTSAPSAASLQTSGNEVLAVFAKGTDNAVYMRTSRDGSVFDNWQSIGNNSLFAPSSISLNQSLFVFAANENKELWVNTATLGQGATPPPSNPFPSVAPLPQSSLPPAPQVSFLGKNQLFSAPYPSSPQYGPNVLHEPGWQSYLMYYCKGSTVNGLWTDRIWRRENWNDGKYGPWVGDQIVIQGTQSQEDALSCAPSVAIDSKGIWHMYYVTAPNGRMNGPFNLYLHHATSTAPGINWTKQGRVNGIPQPYPGYLDSPSTVVTGNTINLYYIGDGGGLYKTTSTDGSNFTTPVLLQTPSSATHGRVVLVNGVYYYVYSKLPPGEPYIWPLPDTYTLSREIALAKSFDGEHFSPATFLMAANGTGWDGKYMFTPGLLIQNNELRVYYAGTPGPCPGCWVGSNTSIGLSWYNLGASSPPPPPAPGGAVCKSLGGILTDEPSEISFNGFLLVFAKGSDNALYLKRSSDGVNFTDWQNLGGVLFSAPAVGINNGQLTITVTGTNNTRYYKTSSNGINFSGWQAGDMPGNVTQTISFANKTYQVSRDTDSTLRLCTQ